MKYDWQAVEQYFINTNLDEKLSLKDVSEIFGIPYQTVRRYAAEHKWHSKRYKEWMNFKYKEFLEAKYTGTIAKGLVKLKNPIIK